MRRSPLCIVLIMLLMTVTPSFAAPVPSAMTTAAVTALIPPPPEPGATVHTATVFTLTCGGPTIPKAAILAANIQYPDPDSCNAPMPQSMLPPAHASVHVLPQAGSTGTNAAGFSAAYVQPEQASTPLDTAWGWSQTLLAQRSGVRGQVSAIIPWSYTPASPSDGRTFSFYAPNLQAPNRSCLNTGLLRLRNDPTVGTQDYIQFENFCDGVSYSYSLLDSNVQAQFIRNDVYGLPITTLDTDETTLVGNCFRSMIYRFDINQWATVQTKCGNGPNAQGSIASGAGPLMSPTTWCTGSLNPYANLLLHKNGAGDWIPIAATDNTYFTIGACAQAPHYYAASGQYGSGGFYPLWQVTAG